jgi:hypothetical protein
MDLLAARLKLGERVKTRIRRRSLTVPVPIGWLTWVCRLICWIWNQFQKNTNGNSAWIILDPALNERLSSNSLRLNSSSNITIVSSIVLYGDCIASCISLCPVHTAQTDMGWASWDELFPIALYAPPKCHAQLACLNTYRYLPWPCFGSQDLPHNDRTTFDSGRGSDKHDSSCD